MQLSSLPFDYGVTPLYTEEEFQAKRQQVIKEFADDGIEGYDPVGDDPTFLKGRWTRWGYSGTRFGFSLVSGSPRPWLPRWYKGHDERCNPWVTIILPLFLGEINVRVNRGEQRTWYSEPDPVCQKDMGFPRCPLDHDWHWPHCLPVEVTCPVCKWPFASTTGFWKKDAPGDSPPCCSRECADR